MTVKFNNDYLELLFQGKDLPGKPKFSDEVVKKFKKTVLMLQYAENVAQLRQLKGLNFELLKGDLKGWCSVRVDLKYRLILSIEGDENLIAAEALIVEELTNHYR
jgi:proteic killer suppression protein